MSDMKSGSWALVKDNCPMRLRADEEYVEVYFEDGYEMMFSRLALRRLITLAEEALGS